MTLAIFTRPTRLATTVAIAAVLALSATACSSDSTSRAPAPGRPTSTTIGDVPTSTTAVTSDRSYVATAIAAVKDVAVFDSPGGAPKVVDGETVTIPNPNENGVEAVFLIRRQSVAGPDGATYHEVDLPIRPNGSVGWIKAADTTVSYHGYRLTVKLGAHQLSLSDAGKVVKTYPIAVGTADTPTPGGAFYIKELLQPPDPDGPYGSYAYGLSGYSTVLDSFNGGDGVVGIHGTNDETVIGTDVSHGCIRMRNADIEELVAKLPLGVPVEIEA